MCLEGWLHTGSEDWSQLWPLCGRRHDVFLKQEPVIFLIPDLSLNIIELCAFRTRRMLSSAIVLSLDLSTGYRSITASKSARDSWKNSAASVLWPAYAFDPSDLQEMRPKSQQKIATLCMCVHGGAAQVSWFQPYIFGLSPTVSKENNAHNTSRYANIQLHKAEHSGTYLTVAVRLLESIKAVSPKKPPTLLRSISCDTTTKKNQ